VRDILANLDTASNPNTLTQFILGGLTQTQMMERAHPTFLSIWIGNNDVLGAATSSPNAGTAPRSRRLRISRRATARCSTPSTPSARKA